MDAREWKVRYNAGQVKEWRGVGPALYSVWFIVSIINRLVSVRVLMYANMKIFP